jgi:glutamate dehydrogenase
MALAPRLDANGRIRQVQALLGETTPAAAFAPLLYGRYGPDGLNTLAPGWLAGNTREALQFIADKPKDSHKIRIRSGQPLADAQPSWVVEILNDDMPFLVDSVLAELQARGLSVGWLLHPIFKTKRDGEGRLQAIEGPDENWSDGHQESYIAIHLSALPQAAGAELIGELSAILGEVRAVVASWKPMLHRLKTAIAGLEALDGGAPQPLLQEAVAFLRWLASDHFTFLGVREFELQGERDRGDLVSMAGTGLGLLHDPAVHVLRRGTTLVATTPEIRKFFYSTSPLIITKANVVSRVHRRTHMDYIGVKTYHRDGKLKGELRLVGLFTSQAYVGSPTHIPLLRSKVDAVLEASGHPRASHDGKALLNILDTFPRDELFQIDAEQLQEWIEGILDLETRPRTRVFARADLFDRFVSLLVYVPRDRYTSMVRERIAAALAQAYDGRIAAFYPYFAEGPLVRVQFIVARFAGPTPAVSTKELERKIGEIVRTWEDRLANAIMLLLPKADALLQSYGVAFPAAYADTFAPERALEDIKRIERLGPAQPVAIEFYSAPGEPPLRIHAAVCRFGPPIRLSERVPILENLGFSAIDERSYCIGPRFSEGVREVTLHDMVLETSDGGAIDLAAHHRRLEEAFRAVFLGDADNDGFNRLIITASADWREVAVLRAYASYLRQLGSPFGLRYLADTVTRHAGLARDLLDLFGLRFDPARQMDLAQRKAAEGPIRARIETALGAVPSLDDDRILRQLANLVDATLRTNFFQTGEDGRPPQTIAFKFDARAVEASPQPRPFREIWVYSPRVEGVHLRFNAIARGGIRWSDRAQDFRTEVLGLVRAQLVKNAVIVPSGAKGGFLPKQLPRGAGREEMQKEGVAAYGIFISSLLDLTDNLKDGRVVAPRQVVRHDGDDPYLVVAADKGTATFSDLANQISAEHGFWLGDAFASGGSAGYDHKAMAITARGAWECVKRHFREMDMDIQRHSFRVVGVGDMSGDVFGNAMLLSPALLLLAAFDHRDVFIDPNPDAAISFAERKRLFDLPRSSWQDYDRAKISKGGGVFSRALKSIPLSEEIRKLIGSDAVALAPNELMRALLKCDSDLIWFGGIGTYVRGSAETDAEVGDRANDGLRVAATELRVKVIGEGANLGMTQRGRIEFAQRGGRLNTDFIDNSAGVNTSDQEVNIKIALGPATRTGRLTLADRNGLLASMTEDVAAASLRNNYQQSLALSLAERRSERELADYPLLMRALEERELLDRRLEALPSDKEMLERGRAGRGLTRPELAVLLSYAKIALLHDLLASKVPDEPQLVPFLSDYFPPQLRLRFADDIAQHSLRREIIATGLTNAIVNRGGPAMAVRLAGETGRHAGEVAHAFMAVREVFDLASLARRLDALDGKVNGLVQLALYQAVQDLVQEETRWFLRDGGAIWDLTGTIARHRAGVAALKGALDVVLPVAAKAKLEAAARQFAAQHVPADLAHDVAALKVLASAPPITILSAHTNGEMAAAAAAFFAVGETIGIADLVARAGAIKVADYYDRLAIGQALGQLDLAQLALSREAIGKGSLSGLEAKLASAKAMLDETLGADMLTLSRLLVAAGQLATVAALDAPSPAAKPDRQPNRARSAASGSPPSQTPEPRPRS